MTTFLTSTKNMSLPHFKLKAKSTYSSFNFSFSMMMTLCFIMPNMIHLTSARIPPVEVWLEALKSDPEMLSLRETSNHSLNNSSSSIETELSECIKNAIQREESTLQDVDEESEDGTLFRCCGGWEMRDCYVNSLEPKFKAHEHKIWAQKLHYFILDVMPSLNDECADYQPLSKNCAKRYMAITANTANAAVPVITADRIDFKIILCIILFVLICPETVYYYISLLKRSRKKDSNHLTSKNDLMERSQTIGLQIESIKQKRKQSSFT